MGDDAVPVARTPTVDLIAQVNRFTRAGDFGGTVYRLDLASGNPIAGALSTLMLQASFRDLAITAILIHQTRLLTAQMAIVDAGTATQIAAAAKALGDPVGYVNANLAMLTQSIGGYADQKGLPPAVYTMDGASADGGLSPTLLIVAAVGAGLIVWSLASSSKRRR